MTLSRKNKRGRRQDLKHLLNDYFDWLERAADKTGYPIDNVLSNDFSTSGKPGHKILCADMPAKYRKVTAAINKLDSRFQAVIFARYALHRDPVTSKLLTNKEKADVLGVTRDKFQRLLRQAEKALQRFL